MLFQCHQCYVNKISASATHPSFSFYPIIPYDFFSIPNYSSSQIINITISHTYLLTVWIWASQSWIHTIFVFFFAAGLEFGIPNPNSTHIFFFSFLLYADSHLLFTVFFYTFCRSSFRIWYFQTWILNVFIFIFLFGLFCKFFK